MGTSPYEKGRMSSFCKSAADEASTFSPALKTSTSLTISIEPLVILDEMLRAWRKDVIEGSREVIPLGTVTPHCARAPAFAGDAFLLSRIMSRTLGREALVNTSATLSLHARRIFSSS